jgi:Ca-activated chloride channel family protein
LWFLSLAALSPSLALYLKAQQEPHLRVDVGLVNASVSVRDAGGSYITGLTRDDFEVFEDGVPQNIQFFEAGADSPLTIGLLEDASDSQDRFNHRHRRDTDAFLREVLRPDDRAFLIGFGDYVRLVAELTSSPQAIERFLQQYDHHPRNFPVLGEDEERHGGTALFDAVFFSARRKMKLVDGRKALLVFSDGEDNSSVRSLTTAIEAAQGADALVYAIRYTEVRHHELSPVNLKGMAAMKRLAEETGGRDFDAGAVEMREVFTQIGAELRSLYEIAYTSNNPVPDGAFRKIEIRARNSRYKVRARAGYTAR